MQSTAHQGVWFRLIIAGMFVCLMAIVCAGFGLMPTTYKNSAKSGFRSVLHWRDAHHNWLLVVDHQTHDVQVYNAADGRPLGRLGSLRQSLANSKP